MAMSLVNLTFDDESRPIKTSVRTDGYGAYFDLVYMTPFIGLQHKKQIETFVFHTGWRVHISQNINQGQLMSVAEAMCIDEGIVVKKTSFLPGDMAVRVVTDVPLPESLVNAFYERTGCSLLRK